MAELTTESLTLADAGQRYLGSLQPAARRDQTSEVNRFVRWFGPDRRLNDLRGVDIERYAAENAKATDVESRLRVLRNLLAYAKKTGLTDENLSQHVRVRRTGSGGGGAEMIGDDRVEVTAEGLTALQADLANLKSERPKIAQALAEAMADKDFRENAPLDAAREHQAHVEARIRELEAMLKRAVVVSNVRGGLTARLGSRVTLSDLQTGKEMTYVLVGPGEVNAAEGRISVSSPVGRALLDHVMGDEVEVMAPSKTFRYRVESIDS